MRNQIQQAFDAMAFDAAISAGHASQLLLGLDGAGSIRFDDRLGPVEFRLPSAQVRFNYAQDGKRTLACDAQPQLVTTNNAGIPAFLSNVLDPKLIRTLVSPMKAATILGEMQKGDWTTTVATFKTVESAGETSAYGDYSESGSVSANLNFPQRQAFHYQTFTQWGERELANAGLAQVDWAGEQNIASALILKKFQNKSYFFGISGLQNYGLLNDPSLYAAIAPTAAWNLAGTSAETVYEDIRRMYVALVGQADGVVEMDMPMTLALSPTLSVALAKTNQYNVNVKAMLALNFPKLRIETAVEYSTDAGELVQLIVDSIDGQETASAAYTEQMRAHAIVVGSSSWRQKKSSGTFGTVIFRPYAIAQLIGA